MRQIQLMSSCNWSVNFDFAKVQSLERDNDWKSKCRYPSNRDDSEMTFLKFYLDVRFDLDIPPGQ